MLGATHMCVGAAAGSFCKKKTHAFFVGLLTHLVLDILPHSDKPFSLLSILAFASMIMLTLYKKLSVNSFIGAFGGVFPDFEHVLVKLGVYSPKYEIFPSHILNGKFHGKDLGEQISQLALIIISLVTLLLKKKNQKNS